MSKATVKKALAEFDAPQLRLMILDLYSKSKEAKEILDFFAVPEIDKKSQEYLNLIVKEIYRVKHYLPAMRVREIRSLIKRFERLSPGDEAIGNLMAKTMLHIMVYAQKNYIEDGKVEQITTLFDDTLRYLSQRRMLDDYIYIFEKKISNIYPNSSFCYQRSSLACSLKNYMPE